MDNQKDANKSKRSLYNYMPYWRPSDRDKGNDFEVNLTTLLALRILRDGDEDSWLATNADGMGAFDDVIVNFKNVTYLLQLKHQETDKPVTKNELTYKPKVMPSEDATTNPSSDKNKQAKKKKGRLSIYKHAKSITELRETQKNEVTKSVTKYLSKKIFFCIYTNRTCPDHGLLEKVDEDEVEYFSLLDTSKSEQSKKIYKIKIAQFEGIENPDDCKTMRLLAGQRHDHDIKELIQKEIQKIVNEFDLLDINVKATVDSFSVYIREWAQGHLGGHYCLTRKHIMSFIAKLLLSPYSCLNNKQKFPKNSPKEWNQSLLDWHELIKDKRFTVVKAENEDHLKYLKQFIFDQTKQYCTDAEYNWNDPFTKESRTAFFRYHEELKQSMLHIIGNKGKLSYDSIYQGSWFEGNIPLLLSMDNKQLNLFKFLNSYGCELKFILICKTPESLKAFDSTENVFVSLGDLNERGREMVLNKKVKLQGRVTQKLHELIASESMYNLVTVSHVIQIINDKFEIGNPFSSVPKYCIKPHLQRLLFSMKVLAEKDNYYVLENPKNISLEISTISLQEFNHSSKHAIIMLNGEYPAQIKKKLSNSSTPIHHFKIWDKQTLEWIESTESVETIRNHRILNLTEQTWITLEEKLNDQNTYFFKKVPVIINAIPGMGKTTIMNYIATKASNRGWILNIDLKKHTNYFTGSYKPQCEDIIQYFCEASFENCIDPSNKKLFLAIINNFVKNKDMLLLLDGFDEISVDFKEKVTEIMAAIQRSGYSVWVTTRPVMQQHLENALLSFSTTLKPFSRDDQVKFLEGFYRYECEFSLPLSVDSQTLLVEFINKLLEIAETKLNGITDDFAAVPLQLKLLADVFQEDCKKYINKKKTKLNAMDLLDLYEIFFKKMFNVYYYKWYKKPHFKTVSLAKEVHTAYKAHQELIALKSLFDSKYLKKLNINKKLEKYRYNKNNKAQKLQEGGIVIAYKKFNEEQYSFVFIHRTFAEFMAAQWLVNNYNNKSSPTREVVRGLLETRYFGNHYEFLFKILDLMLCRKSKIHNLIINGKLSDVSRQLKTKPQMITEKDAGGRSALHLIVLYDSIHINAQLMRPFMFANTTNIQSMYSVVDLVAPEIIRQIKSDAFGHDAIYYAIRSFSLDVANSLCEKLPSYEINSRVPPSNKREYFGGCAKFKCHTLFKKLLKHFVLRDLLDRNVKPDESVKSYCQFDHQAEHQFLKEMSTQCLSEIVSVNETNYDNLHLAAAFGAKQNVISLVKSGVDVNEVDVYNNTPLHYAVRHERLDIIEILLNKRAQINKAGDDGRLPLHLAAKTGNSDITEYLLNNGGRINQTDDDGRTPLLLALIKGQIATASLLISKGADPNINDVRGGSSICAAALVGANDIISQLVNKGVDVNAEDGLHNIPLHYAVSGNHISTVELLLNKGSKIDSYVKPYSLANIAGAYSTPLIMAIWSNNVNMVKLLLLHNADYNLKDSNKDTVLHQAVGKRNEDIVQELLNSNIDINMQNCKQLTPLHISLALREENIANLLLSKNPDVNIQENKKMAPLHIAVATNSLVMVNSLIHKGANIEVADCNQHTPLHLALYCGYCNIAELLLKHNASVNVLSDLNEAPIHFASRIGNSGLLEKIIEKGAKVNVQDDDGCSPLHWAVNMEAQTKSNLYSYKQCPISLAPLNMNEQLINILLENGININAQNAQGETALHIACSSALHLGQDITSYRRIIQLLQGRGADVNISNAKGVKCCNLLSDIFN